MHSFEYEITKHPADTFKELVYFCTATGECSLELVPQGQTQKLENFFNERGQLGWELVQVTFGRDGLLAFWKRVLAEDIP